VIQELGEVEVSVVKAEILLRAGAAFGSLKVKKNCVGVTFYLDHLDSEPPIKQTYQVSKTRVIHYMEIFAQEDINERVLFLLNMAYDLIKKDV
jgi:hypothetical protein